MILTLVPTKHNMRMSNMMFIYHQMHIKEGIKQNMQEGKYVYTVVWHISNTVAIWYETTLREKVNVKK